MPINSIHDAFRILDNQEEGIPYEAIQYLMARRSNSEIDKKIFFALKHAYDGTFNREEDKDSRPTPLWYAIVAEKHLSAILIDPVISLFTNTYEDWDFLNEQGMFVLGQLAEKYPEMVMKKVMAEIDGLIEYQSEAPYLFLFDAFHFVSVNKYKKWFLSTLQKEDLFWRAPFVIHIADLRLKEAIPIIESLLEEKNDPWEIGDLEEGLEQLESGVDKYPDQSLPYCKSRGDWRKHYEGFESSFNNKPERAPEKVGRNDPCPCGSGKKYKRCYGK